MAITIHTNFGTEQDIKDAMLAAGVTPAVDEPSADAGKEPEKKPSEQKVEPGAEGTADDSVKTAPDSEPDKKPSQEGESQEKKPKESKGGFQVKIEKLTAKVDRLHDDLESERGDKHKLETELAEAKRQLAEASGTAKKEVKDELVKPVRPELPDLAELDYDQEKFAEAMRTYRVELKKFDDAKEAYDDKLLEKKIADANTKRIEEDRAKTAQAESEKLYNEYVERKNAGSEHYPDLDDLLSSVPSTATDIFANVDGKPSGAHAYLVLKSKEPAALLHFFAKDMAEDGSKESQRFAGLDAVDLVLELNALERRLAGEREKKSKKEAGKEAATETTSPEKKDPPVAQPQKKLAKTPDAPLDPVGGTAAPVSGDLNKLMSDAASRGDSKEFRRLLELQYERKAQLRS